MYIDKRSGVQAETALRQRLDECTRELTVQLLYVQDLKRLLADSLSKAEHNRIVTETILSLDAERTEFERQLTELTVKLEGVQSSLDERIIRGV